MSSADIDALAGHPTVRCGLEFDFPDVVVAADGTPYASLVDGCTAEKCHFRLGLGFVGHLVSEPPLVGTAGEQRPRVHAAAALPGGRCESGCGSHGVVGWSASGPTSTAGGCVRCEAAGCARRSSSSAFRAVCPGHDRGPDEHRADGGAYAPLSAGRALSSER